MTQTIRNFAAVLVVSSMAVLAAGEELRVKDLPIPEGAAEVTIMKRRGDVRFNVTTDFRKTGDWYAKQLGAQRWRKSGKDNLQQDFWVQKFARDKLAVEVRVDSIEGGSEVRLTPTGLLWDEDLAPHAKEAPIPDDATNLEYDDFFEEIEFQSPSDVKTISDFLSQSLEKLEWAVSGTDQVTDDLARLERTKGQSSLTITVRSEETGSSVSIDTKGMNWDGIEEANELAEKSAKEADDDEPSSAKPLEEPAPLPKRKDKPKQGIADLPKLPSEGAVTMDGKTYKLTNVIAYEVYAGDRWSTKIIATQKPVKQEALLARLKNSESAEDQSGQPAEGLNLPQPYVQLEVDDDDRLQRMSLLADNTPGGASGDELTGSALVEDGRARGTAKMKEPGDFFDKVYTAEISFDVPVLTRDSTPAKRLAGAPKLASGGTVTLGAKTVKLTRAVAYQMKQFDEPVTAVVLSEKPLNMAKLKAALGKKSIDDYFEFTPQVKLIVDQEDNVVSTFIWMDNTSLSGNDELSGDIVIEDGRARGTAKMTEPGEFFDEKYTFELSFDVDVLSASPAAKKPDGPSSGLVADSYDGLPFPEERQSISSEGSRFRKEITTTVDAKLDAVVRFYRQELSSEEWKEDVPGAKVEQQSARLSFAGPMGGLVVELKAEGDQTAITLITRDARAAKAAGLFPASGKSRLVVGNASEAPATVTINKRDYRLAAGAGADDPKTGLNWELAPGKYTVKVNLADGDVQSEVVTVGADETWGVIVVPTGGFLVVQLY